jgi:hypothetical protein
MKSLTIQIEDPILSTWKSLPPECQNLLTTKALNAILQGIPYPTGSDQLELAIELAESGVDADVISQLTRLDKSVFNAFLQSGK